MPPKVSASIKHFLAKEATVGFLDFACCVQRDAAKSGQGYTGASITRVGFGDMLRQTEQGTVKG